MKDATDRNQTLARGSCCFERRAPPGQSTSSTASSGTFHHLLRAGAAVLIVGAVLMLCASMAALYLWKVSDKNVYNVHYSMNINGEVRRGSMEIDADNNLGRFKTGSGAEEAVEIHDFQTGITGIRFFGGDKCYVKSQIKADLPHMGARREETPPFDLTDELMPVRFDEDFLVWVADEQPLKDTRFLSDKLLDLCGDLPVFWLQPTYSKDGERKERGAQRARRQLAVEELEPAAEEDEGPARHGERGAPRATTTTTTTTTAEEEEEEGAQSAAGSAYNPENPYQRSGGGGAREESAVTFDTMLDHQGICCSECQRGYTHCQRVCEPLRGYWPWPYHYRGCQVACRVIMPCRWWVARILGVV